MYNPDLQISQPFVVQSTYQVGTSYTAGNVFSMANHNAIGIEVDYDKGNETSLEVKVEVSNDGGTTYAQQSTESTSGGTITVALGERTFSASGIYSLLITPIRAGLVKISSKSTYGTVATGSCSIRSYPLWV